MVIIGIKNLNDVLCQVLLLYGVQIIAFIKGIQFKAVYRLCIKDTQGIDNAIAKVKEVLEGQLK